MKLLPIFCLVCAAALISAVTNLPIGYYTFLRILISGVSLVIVLSEINRKQRFWPIVFLLVGLLFNPVFPVYLYDKGKWMEIDLVVALVFGVYGWKKKQHYNPVRFDSN